MLIFSGIYLFSPFTKIKPYLTTGQLCIQVMRDRGGEGDLSSTILTLKMFTPSPTFKLKNNNLNDFNNVIFEFY